MNLELRKNSKIVFTHFVVSVSVLAIFLISFFVNKVAAKATSQQSVQAVQNLSTGESAAENDAALDVATVFGRSRGCNTADHAFIRLVAKEALSTKTPPKVLAAVIAIESQCNQFAVSRRGAIGYTQVMPSVWGKSYDFSSQYNLFNPHDNLHIGGLILAGYIRQYGLQAGVQHYLGTGVGCADCDPSYGAKVVALSNR